MQIKQEVAAFAGSKSNLEVGSVYFAKKWHKNDKF